MRAVLTISLWLLLLPSLGLGLLYARTPYATLAAQVAAPNYALEDGVVVLPLSPARYQALRLGLALVAGAAGSGLGLLAWGRRGGQPRRRGRASRAAWGRPLARLSRGERVVAGGLLLAAAGVRVWFAVGYPLSLDEVASYDFAVLPGLALTASYYPIPNNHLLPNLLVGLVHQLLPGADALVALRLLPTLLGLALLPLGYALLLRYLPFAVATLGWGLFSLSPLPAFYAVAGRGYGWALAALLAGLAASLALLRPQGLGRAGRRRAWAVFGASAVLGLYAVPTHLYGLLGLGLALGVGFGRWRGRRRGLHLLHLAGLAIGVGLATAVLYAPVVAVSGWPALGANRYVLRLAPADFWANLGPYYLLGTASELLGRRAASAAVFGVVAGLAPLALRWGRLPEPARRLGWVLYAQLLLWLPLVLAQRVYPPARTLLVVLLALLVLAALVARVGLQGWWPLARMQAIPPAALPTTPWPVLVALALLLSSYGVYRFHREQAVINAQARQQQVLGRAYRWLRARHPRRVEVPAEARSFMLFWHHYALNAAEPPLPLVLTEGQPPPGMVGSAGAGPAYEVQLAPAPGPPAAYAEEQVVLRQVTSVEE